MFKITVGLDGYNLHEYNRTTRKYNPLLKNTSIDTIIKYNVTVLKGAINPGEIELAVKDIEDSRNNTVEFGMWGTYTVPYYDENVV